MRLGVVGSRSWKNYDVIFRAIRSLCNKDDDLRIVTGYDPENDTPKGVDKMAFTAARELDLPFKLFPADWKKYGKSAGYKRNPLIVENSDKVVAFWDGVSGGTRNTIGLALDAGKLEVVVLPDLRRLYPINFQKGGW